MVDRVREPRIGGIFSGVLSLVLVCGCDAESRGVSADGPNFLLTSDNPAATFFARACLEDGESTFWLSIRAAANWTVLPAGDANAIIGITLQYSRGTYTYHEKITPQGSDVSMELLSPGSLRRHLKPLCNEPMVITVERLEAEIGGEIEIETSVRVGALSDGALSLLVE
ncbi:MAG: hypothetical protein H6713_26910 [Myxococcales bacterium]|nr:hypothetical protein [Myxococcales bacterium]MCB9753589.1 hypothetical protein [Myxococcales bacterium]